MKRFERPTESFLDIFWRCKCPWAGTGICIFLLTFFLSTETTVKFLAETNNSPARAPHILHTRVYIRTRLYDARVHRRRHKSFYRTQSQRLVHVHRYTRNNNITSPLNIKSDLSSFLRAPNRRVRESSAARSIIAFVDAIIRTRPIRITASS